MKAQVGALVAALGLLAAVWPALAHHSFSAEFDSKRSLTLQGVVTKVDWMNPHIWIYLDAKDEAGAVTHWQCEGAPPPDGRNVFVGSTDDGGPSSLHSTPQP